jgi:hypothetical protein
MSKIAVMDRIAPELKVMVEDRATNMPFTAPHVERPTES